MTAMCKYLHRVSSLRLSAWPICALVLFSALTAIHALPGGYVRAIAAVPTVLLVPGSLAVGAVFGGRSRPQGILFIGYAIVLSVLLSIFASLALYAAHVPITALSTYFVMLGLSAVLAVVAQARLFTERPAVVPQAVGRSEPLDRETPNLGDDPDRAARIRRFAPIAAIVTGVSLLAGSVYFYDHLPRPSDAGYTQLAWASTREASSITVGPEGDRLYFEIVHRQPRQAWFRLNAVWQGSSAQALAKPLTLSIGPDKTLQGDLFVPAPPGQCTYRLVITLTEIDQVDPLTKQQPTWSINANVRESGKSRSACAQ